MIYQTWTVMSKVSGERLDRFLTKLALSLLNCSAESCPACRTLVKAFEGCNRHPVSLTAFKVYHNLRSRVQLSIEPHNYSDFSSWSRKVYSKLIVVIAVKHSLNMTSLQEKPSNHKNHVHKCLSVNLGMDGGFQEQMMSNVKILMLIKDLLWSPHTRYNWFEASVVRCRWYRPNSSSMNKQQLLKTAMKSCTWRSSCLKAIGSRPKIALKNKQTLANLLLFFLTSTSEDDFKHTCYKKGKTRSYSSWI